MAKLNKAGVLKIIAFAMKNGKSYEESYAIVHKIYYKGRKGKLPKLASKVGGLRGGEVPIAKRILDWIGNNTVDASEVVNHFDINASTAHGGMMKLVRVGVLKREAVKGVYFYSKCA